GWRRQPDIGPRVWPEQSREKSPLGSVPCIGSGCTRQSVVTGDTSTRANSIIGYSEHQKASRRERPRDPGESSEYSGVIALVKILFWGSMFLVVYAYFGYPFLLWAFTRVKSRRVLKSQIVPPISIIIAARNEAEKNREKIENTLTLTYPSDRLEILVASDASDDGTDDIVTEYAARGVRLVRASERKGKEHVQGLAVAVATGDVIVFTD